MATTIVVAVGSAGSRVHALLWAAGAAHDRGAAHDLVHASRHPRMEPDPGDEQVTTWRP